MTKTQKGKVEAIKKCLQDPVILSELLKEYHIRKRVEGFICNNTQHSSEKIDPEHAEYVYHEVKIGFKK